jgi:hypothetical protein
MVRGYQVTLAGGDGFTYGSVAGMRSLVRQAALFPIVRAHAVAIVGGFPVQLHPTLLRDWVAEHTLFLRDPSVGELFHQPDLLLSQIDRNGVTYVDCDDVAMLSAALGLSVGLRARFVVVAFGSPSAPYRHIWTELRVPLGNAPWIAVDPTRPAQGLTGVSISRSLMVDV